MAKKREGEKTLNTWEQILASLIGVMIALIISYMFNMWILSSGEQAGLALIVTIPCSFGLIFTGMLGGWLGADIATRKLPRFRRLELPKWLVIVLDAAVGGILGVILPLGIFLLIVWLADVYY